MGYIQDIYDLFKSREDVYALCKYRESDQKYFYTKQGKPYDLEVLTKHITNAKFNGIGVYPLLPNSKCHWIAADLDAHDVDEEDNIQTALERLWSFCNDINLNLYHEKSKSGRGSHIWLFFTEEIDSWKARKFMMGVFKNVGLDNLTEMDRFFPSQDNLNNTEKNIGNLIHMPFSAKHIKYGTWFEDQDGNKYKNSAADIKKFIKIVERHTPEFIDTFLAKWGYSKEEVVSIDYDDNTYEYLPDGIQKVLEDPFIQWCKDNPTGVNYSAWIAMISNLLPFGDEGSRAVHQISSLDVKRYNKDATERKIIQMQGVKPITYKWISENTHFETDESIDHKSPVVLGTRVKNTFTPIIEVYGKYFIKNKASGEKKEIANFTIRPKSLVEIEGKIERLFDFVSQNSIIKDIPVTGAILSSLDSFKRMIMDLSHDLLFYGTVSNLLRLVDYLNQTHPSIPKVIGKKAIGMYRVGDFDNWAVLTQQGSWTRNGKTDDIMYYNPSISKEIVFAQQVELKKSTVEHILAHLFNFNTLAVTTGILGWLGCLFVKERLYQLKGLRFPVLVIHGQAGSGKTETTRNVIQKICGDQSQMFSIGDLTKFVFLSLSGSSNMFPIFLDEYKPSLFEKSKIQMISQMVRNVYDNASASRGRADQSTVEYKVITPAVICGEEGFNEPALIERSIDIFLSKSESADHLESFNELKKLPLINLGNAFMNWTLRLKDADLQELYRRECGDNSNDRVTHNIAMVKVGLELWKFFLKNVYEIDMDMDEYKKLMEKAQLDIIKQSGDTMTVVDHTLIAFLTMWEMGRLDGQHLKYNAKSSELFIYVRGIYPEFKRWARETDYEYEILSEMEFCKQIQKMKYFNNSGAKRMKGDKVKKVYQLEVKWLIEAGITDDDFIVALGENSDIPF